MSLDLFFDIPKEEKKTPPVPEVEPIAICDSGNQTKGYMDLIKKMGDEDRSKRKMDFGDPEKEDTNIETYLLLGMFLDFGYFNDEEKQKEIGEILNERWNKHIDRDSFEKYFKDHEVSPETFNLI